MKQNLFSLMMLYASLWSAQSYSNGNLSTGTTSSNGTAAPSGYTWSELQPGNATLGFSAFKSANDDIRLTDDFTVPASESWALSSVEIFGYQTSSSAFPINQMNLRIFDAAPTVGTLVFGDATTNVLNIAESGDALMYRIAADIGTSRKIWKFKANISKTLMPGTYWLDYQVHAINDGLVYFPPVTIVGATGAVDGNAMQENLGVYVNINDLGSGAAQAMPFIITYVATSLGTTETRQLDSRVVVYPNPTADSFQLSLPYEVDNARTEISIFDQSGKKVKSFKLANHYDVSDLPKGMYIIKVNDGENIKAVKLIKK